MAIQYVGGRSGGFPGSTSGNTNVALNSGLTGGIGASVATGDLVIVAYGTGSSADRTLLIQNPSAVAYTLIGSELYSDGTTYDTNLRVAYRFMPSPAEASVQLGPTGAGADGGAYVIHVYRGVDTTTPLDVAATTATATGTARPNPPSITPTTSGAFVVVATCGAAIDMANTFTFASATNLLQGYDDDTNEVRTSLATYTWTSGALDPAASTTGSNVAADSWAAISIALRPDPTIFTSIIRPRSAFQHLLIR